MATGNLIRMSDLQLRKLHTISQGISFSSRRAALRAELERRGYVYDLRSKDFIPCEEWNTAHADEPKPCNERMKSLRKGVQRDG